MTDIDNKRDVLPQRLCSEIQLFDLCDLASCKYKNGRYCTDPVLVGRFEKIAENELRVPDLYTSDEDDGTEMDDDDSDGYDDALSEGYDGGEDDWEDEE